MARTVYMFDLNDASYGAYETKGKNGLLEIKTLFKSFVFYLRGNKLYRFEDDSEPLPMPTIIDDHLLTTRKSDWKLFPIIWQSGVIATLRDLADTSEKRVKVATNRNTNDILKYITRTKP